MNKEEITRVCKVCKRTFVAYRSNQLYCSDSCREIVGATYRRSVKKKHQKKCDMCGRTYTTNRSNSRFCSEDCYKEYYNRLRSTIKAPTKKGKCAICGAEFETTKPNQLYCSKTCYVEANRVRLRERAEQARRSMNE